MRRRIYSEDDVQCRSIELKLNCNGCTFTEDDPKVFNFTTGPRVCPAVCIHGFLRSQDVAILHGPRPPARDGEALRHDGRMSRVRACEDDHHGDRPQRLDGARKHRAIV